ncbi:MAG: response regulator [Cyclobacteriaceae bacterium]
MDQTTCMAIDDDAIFLRKLSVFIDDIDWLSLKHTYTNSVKGATALISNKPDLLFLDMEMPHAGGGYLMDWLEPKINEMEPKPKVIIVTSLEASSIEGLPNVTGYINKFDLKSSEVLEGRLKEILGS